MKMLFVTLSVFLISSEAMSLIYSVRPTKRDSLYNKSDSALKAGMNTYAKTFEDAGRIKVSVRGCGSRVVITNSKGENPPVGEVIQLNMSRCKIIDWVK